MAGPLSLDVTAWSAILAADAEVLGAAGPVSEVPAGMRRRAPAFCLDVLRCALPLLRAAPGAPVVYASTNGDLASTVDLLRDIANNELLSPAKFTMSVHNAPTGALGLCMGRPGEDTAITNESACLAAGLTEAYARIACGDERILLILSEAPLPAVYRDHDETAPGAVLAVMLQAASAQPCAKIAVGRTRADAIAAIRSLAAGARRFSFAPPQIQARAA